jgi:hypothetical protein
MAHKDISKLAELDVRFSFCSKWISLKPEDVDVLVLPEMAFTGNELATLYIV